MTMSISRCLADWDWTSSHFLSTRAAKAAPSPGTLESLNRSHHGLAVRSTRSPQLPWAAVIVCCLHPAQ